MLLNEEVADETQESCSRSLKYIEHGNASRSQMPPQQAIGTAAECKYIYLHWSVDMLVHPIAGMACFTRGLLQVHTRFVNAQIWRGCVALRLLRYVCCQGARWTHMEWM